MNEIVVILDDSEALLVVLEEAQPSDFVVMLDDNDPLIVILEE